jgi:hypothetical protein
VSKRNRGKHPERCDEMGDRRKIQLSLLNNTRSQGQAQVSMLSLGRKVKPAMRLFVICHIYFSGGLPASESFLFSASRRAFVRAGATK